MVSLLFYRPANLQGRLVGWWTGSPWAHVAIRHHIAGQSLISQADPVFGVCVWRESRARKPDAILELPWMDETWVFDFLARHWGKPYGWRDILSFLIRRRSGDGYGLICTELAAEMLTSYVAEWPTNIPGEWAEMLHRVAGAGTDDLTPGELYNICAEYAPDGIRS